ncbi:MAG: hypothetical protein IJZ89_08515 [Clostridia bacterium]|nr:hypothetical protein [Clostridia bacterium]
MLYIPLTLLIAVASVLMLSAIHFMSSGEMTWTGFEKVNQLRLSPIDTDSILAIDESLAAYIIEANKQETEADTTEKEEDPNAPISNPGKTDENPESGEIRDHILKVTAAVGEDYFADTLFIGDSRMLGLSMTWQDSGATFYASVGLSINQLNTKKVIKADAETAYTVMEAIERDEKDYKRIYLMFGLNELGWGYPSVFVRSVKTAIEQIREYCPNAEFCIMAIMPIAIDKTVSIYTGPVANERIREFNTMLLGLASELNCWYLDTYNLLADAEGNLPEGFAADGIHMYSEQNKRIISYISTHAFAY